MKTDQTEFHNWIKSKGFSILKSTVSQSSRGLEAYARVTFVTSSEATKALETLHGQQYDNRELRVGWERNREQMDNKSANIYIKEIPQEAKATELEELFSQYGEISSAKVETWPNGDSRGFGFVQYKDPSNAAKAIEAMNNYNWNGNTLIVNKFVPRQERAQDTNKPTEYNNLYVANFPREYKESDLKALFEKYGKITSLYIPTSQQVQYKTCHGYVCFETFEAAKEAQESLNGATVPGTDLVLQVNAHKKKNEREAINLEKVNEQKAKNKISNLTNNLFFKRLPSYVTEAELRKECEVFGEVSSIKMKTRTERGPNGEYKPTSTGSAYVSFADSKSAQKAIYEITLNPVFDKKVVVDYFQPKV